MADVTSTSTQETTESAAQNRWRSSAWRGLEGMVSFSILMLIIEGGIRLFDVQPYVFPAPSAIGLALVEGIASGLYLRALWVTLTEILGGFAIGSACGILLGIGMVQIPVLN